MYRFSSRSLDRLEYVNPTLILEPLTGKQNYMLEAELQRI
jgi:hypothetical protein